MVTFLLTDIPVLANQLAGIINYEIVRGNRLWRFVLMLLVLLAVLAIGRIVQYAIETCEQRTKQKKGTTVSTLFLSCLSKPVYVAIFALGLFVCKLCLHFSDTDGIRLAVGSAWVRVAKTVAAVAVAYGLYKLVDVAEYYLGRIVSKTETKLDDMLIPVVRKALRITIAVIAILFIAESVLGAEQIKTVLLSAGVGGIAIALAAKDTVSNFFGSITIFADRPFQIDELVRIDGHLGPVEEVGFRSTRIRTLNGHQVTIPNSVIASSIIENLGKRPFIRRTANITITYDSGHDKTRRAIEIIKQILSEVPEVNSEPDKPPRVYFSEFNDCSLNIYVSYWVKPPDYWLYHQVNDKINFEILKRFDAEGIEFAFPTQTLYLKKD